MQKITEKTQTQPTGPLGMQTAKRSGKKTLNKQSYWGTVEQRGKHLANKKKSVMQTGIGEK